MPDIKYVGLDLGSSFCHQVVINFDGSVRLSRSIPTSEFALRNAFNNLGSDVRVHLEASELAAWVRSVIKPFVNQIVVSHPRTLAWIAKDFNKSDSIDARKLAELLRLNRLHEVYYEPDDKRQIFKQLVVSYEEISREQARLKTKIKARLRCFGVIRKDARVFTQAGRNELLKQIEIPEIQQICQQSFNVLDALLAAQSAAKQAMMTASNQFPEVRLLETAPGVGAITACRFVAYLQTPYRFSNKRKLWRYCRLGITRRQSNGQRISFPRLDSSGCGSLKDVSRKIFEGALRTTKHNSFKRAFEESLARTKNKVHARLSTQRKILACLRAMWVSMKPYNNQMS